MKHRIAFRSMNGFSLMEVLVALLVLSVGLLGLAALQAEGLRGSSTAQYRFQAIRLMGDMIDRMQANRAGVAVDPGLGVMPYAVTTAGAGVDRSCVEDADAAVVCTAVQMAEHDIFVWKNELVAQLGAGTTGEIAAVVGTANRVTITVRWTERAEAKLLRQEVQF